MYRIFTGANGYYVAWEREDGSHHQPQDNGARIGFVRVEAERERRRMEHDWAALEVRDEERAALKLAKGE